MKVIRLSPFFRKVLFELFLTTSNEWIMMRVPNVVVADVLLRGLVCHRRTYPIGTLNASTIDAQLRNKSSEVSSTDAQTNLQRVANEHHLEMQKRAKTLGRKVNVQVRPTASSLLSR